MNFQDVLKTIRDMENGEELATVVEGELLKVAGEAKKYRTSNRAANEKAQALLEALGLEDGEDAVERARDMKGVLDSFAQGGKKPTEVAKQIADLTKQVTTLTNNYNEMTKTAQAEKAKRLDAMKKKGNFFFVSLV